LFEDASDPNDGRFDSSVFILFGDVIADDFDFVDFLECLPPPPPPPPIAEDVDELFDEDMGIDVGLLAAPPPPLLILPPPADGPLLLLL